MAEASAEPKIRFACSCGKTLAVAAEKAGRKVRCPGCQAVLMVPAADGETAAPQAEVRTVNRVDAPTEQPAPTSQPVASRPAPEASTSAPAATHLPTPGSAGEVELPELPENPDAATESQREVQAPAPRPSASGSRAAASGARRNRVGAGSGSRLGAQSSPRNRYARGGKDAKPKSKTPLLIGVGVVVLGILGVAGFFVLDHNALTSATKKIDTQVENARTAMTEGELDDAIKAVDSAKKVLGTRADFAAEKREGWSKAFEEVDSFKERLAKIDSLEAGAKSDALAAQESLQRERALLETSPENKVYLDRIDAALGRVAELERSQFLAKLGKELSEALQIYGRGDISAAADMADQVRTRLSGRDDVKAPELDEQVALLRDAGQRFKDAQSIKARARGNFDEAIKQLDEMAKKLDLAKETDRPLLKKLTQLKSEVEEDKKKYRRLDKSELDRLVALAKKLPYADKGVQVGNPDPGAGVPVTYNGDRFILGSESVGENRQVVIEHKGHRYRVELNRLQKRPGVSYRIVKQLAEGMTAAGITPGNTWVTVEESPFPAAERETAEKMQYFYRGKLYAGEQITDEEDHKKALAGLETAARALVSVIEQDATVNEDTKKVVVKLVTGAYQELDYHDYLPGEWCRRVLSNGYIEQNISEAATRYQAQLATYHAAYDAFIKPSPVFKGESAAGDMLEKRANADGHKIAWTYDKDSDSTSFAIKHPVNDKPLLFVVYEFKGRLDAFPADLKATPPQKAYMTHPAAGVMATYDLANEKFEANSEAWALGAAMTTYPRRPAWMGQPQWAFPPHIFMVTQMGDPLAVVTPAGRLNFPHFGLIDDLKKRRTAQDAYIDELAKVLNSTGLLHLYFLYFHQYVLDSPLENQRSLLGCRAHCGDIHQNVYESLDRELAGRYLGDCDDLAELYMIITRRQGKLSFVMSVPGHATCGWVEKAGGAYRMQFLDTGPPRIVEAADLDTAVETGSRTYDREKTMRFDPKSLGFLFRFAGEPTRTPYYLSTRMFTDRDYATIMEEVQGHWHFHFYALGIKIMEEMIKKGDDVPENLTELAGLYGRVMEHMKAIKLTERALAQLGKKDVLTRMSETFRVGMNYHEAKDDEKAYEAIKESVTELRAINPRANMQLWQRTISNRLTMGNLLNTIDRPWEAYQLLQFDASVFYQRKVMRLDHAGALTGILNKMKDQIAEGKTPTPQETQLTAHLEQLLAAFYQTMLFQDDDDFNDVLRNYAFLGNYYRARFGKEKVVEELLKDGPYPDKERKHIGRATKEDLEEDWKWIRLSPWSYIFAMGDAVDPDKPQDKWRKDEAIKLASSMGVASTHAKKFGSLASTEYYMMTAQVTQAFLAKDWEMLDGILKEVEKRDFARLTQGVAESIGASARFVTPQEFATQYKLFTKYVKTKAHYFSVVYEAFRADAFEHARLAAQHAVQCWPEDENMKRELQFLNQLIEQRAKKEAGAKP